LRRLPFIHVLACLYVLALSRGTPAHAEVATTWEEAWQRLQPLAEASGSQKGRCQEINGKVLTGYQGWFGAEGNGSGLGWQHYGGAGLGPGHCTFDLWPAPRPSRRAST